MLLSDARDRLWDGRSCAAGRRQMGTDGMSSLTVSPLSETPVGPMEGFPLPARSAPVDGPLMAQPVPARFDKGCRDSNSRW